MKKKPLKVTKKPAPKKTPVPTPTPAISKPVPTPTVLAAPIQPKKDHSVAALITSALLLLLVIAVYKGCS